MVKNVGGKSLGRRLARHSRDKKKEKRGERGLEVVSGRGSIHLCIFSLRIGVRGRACSPYNRLFLRILPVRATAVGQRHGSYRLSLLRAIYFFRASLQGCPNDGLTAVERREAWPIVLAGYA